MRARLLPMRLTPPGLAPAGAILAGALTLVPAVGQAEAIAQPAQAPQVAQAPVPGPALSSAAEAFVADATARLIAGEELARDYPVRLQALPPDQRLLVIVHLRRAGYLAGMVMPVDWIMSPAIPADASTAEFQR